VVSRLRDHISWAVHTRNFPDKFILYGQVKLPGLIIGEGVEIETAAVEEEWASAFETVTVLLESEYRRRKATFTMFEDAP
jgi:hypothetical protein